MGQVARIDAHSLAPEGTARFSYCRTVFHAKAGSLLASRTPTQIGAEMYGEAGVGDVGVFRALAQKAGLTEVQQNELFNLLKLKCESDIVAWTEREKKRASVTKKDNMKK